MSEQQMLVPVSFIKDIISRVSIPHIHKKAEILFDVHMYNHRAKVFYSKWQDLEQLSAENLKIVVAMIDALANKKDIF